MSYGVIFNSLNGHNSTQQQIIPNGVATALNPNTFEKVNYDGPTGFRFMGWSLEPYGEVEYEDEQEVLDIAANGEVINLYAVWEKNLDIYHSYIFRPLKANSTGMVDGDTTDTEAYVMATDRGAVLHIYSVDELGSAGTKTITENGTYNAQDDNWDGYSTVTVDVPVPQYGNADFKRY